MLEASLVLLESLPAPLYITKWYVITFELLEKVCLVESNFILKYLKSKLFPCAFDLHKHLSLEYVNLFMPGDKF